MTNVAVVLVTCNSAPGLTETLQSVSSQTQEPTTLIAIDDYSTDQTVPTLRAAGFTVQTSTSTSSDPFTRISQNFVNGVRLAQQRGAEIAVLGDHDDVWHRAFVSARHWAASRLSGHHASRLVAVAREPPKRVPFAKRG